MLRVRALQEQTHGASSRAATNNCVRPHDAEHAPGRRSTALDAGVSLTSQQLAAQQARRAAGLLAASSQHLITGRAEDGVEIARDEWTVAARRVEALERLDERNRETPTPLEFERHRNNEIDDMVLARRGRGPAAGAAVNGALS